MSESNCVYAEVCIHYTNGSKRKSHHIRITNVCKHFLAMDCGKNEELLILQEYTTGQPVACDISKHRRGV